MSDESCKPINKKVRDLVIMIFNHLQPHAQSVRIFSRDGKRILCFELAKDVKVRSFHFEKIVESYRGADPWIEFTEGGLRLCVMLPYIKQAGKRRLEAPEVQPDLKKQRSKENTKV